jgi:hypothetical protein
MDGLLMIWLEFQGCETLDSRALPKSRQPLANPVKSKVDSDGFYEGRWDRSSGRWA